MRRFVFTRPLRLLAVPTLVALATGVACSADLSDSGDLVGNPSPRDGGNQNTIQLDSATADTGSPGGPPLNPLCGSVGFCGRGKIPDDPLACADHSEPGAPVTGRDGGRQEDDFDASVSGDDAQAPDGGAVSVPDASVAPLPDAGTAVPEAGAPPDAEADAGYTPPSTVPENPSPRGERYACQVIADSNGNPSQGCLPAGTGGDGSPCSSTNDCLAGLACVGEVGAGECRTYCCALGGSPCGDVPDGSVATRFCGERLLLEPGKLTPSLRVPVCVPAESCELDEEYPCTGPGCKCGSGDACTVVGTDGTTGCKKPGTGKVGASCTDSCAPGYYCSAQKQCVKTCKLGVTPDPCAPGKCAAVVGFPDGFGICVGLTLIE